MQLFNIILRTFTTYKPNEGHFRRPSQVVTLQNVGKVKRGCEYLCKLMLHLNVKSWMW